MVFIAGVCALLVGLLLLIEDFERKRPDLEDVFAKMRGARYLGGFTLALLSLAPFFFAVRNISMQWQQSIRWSSIALAALLAVAGGLLNSSLWAIANADPSEPSTKDARWKGRYPPLRFYADHFGSKRQLLGRLSVCLGLWVIINSTLSIV